MAAPPGQTADSECSLNINIGILGHVDSGKTSLSRALATCFSTAALDKNPQSKARGITLDLGFSSFMAPAPPHFTAALPHVSQVQVTLVDCPGHASLIRTIIGGAQIIDMMLLVIDVNKLIQTQTAECIVIGEILTDNLVIALNKVDLIPEAQRAQKIEKVIAGLKSAFAPTRFKSPVMIPVSARVGGGDDVAAADITTLGISDLAEALMRCAVVPARSPKEPFLFAVDHCFPIKGQGTVMTGTVLRGSIKIGDEVEVPELSMSRRVKSMQKFKQPSQAAMQGDRVGICVTQFDPALLERGFACAPGSLAALQSFIMPVNLVKYFKLPAMSKQKFHFTIGHSTVVGSVLFFAPPPGTAPNTFGAEHL